MRRHHRGSGQAQQPRAIACALLLIGSGCSNSARSGPKWRTPDETAERTTGCIDTPFIGPDQRSTAGVQCGREASPTAVALRGRVVAQTSAGLPGPGVEAVWVFVHAIEGSPQLDRLPAALAEAETGPQGAFAISLSSHAGTHVGELLIVVRAKPGGPVLAAQRVDPSSSDLVLQVPQTP